MHLNHIIDEGCHHIDRRAAKALKEREDGIVVKRARHARGTLLAELMKIQASNTRVVFIALGLVITRRLPRKQSPVIEPPCARWIKSMA